MLTTVDILWPEGDASGMDPSLRILCTLSELYDRELVSALGWAKQIPGEFYFLILYILSGFWRLSVGNDVFLENGCILPNPIPL